MILFCFQNQLESVRSQCHLQICKWAGKGNWTPALEDIFMSITMKEPPSGNHPQLQVRYFGGSNGFSL